MDDPFMTRIFQDDIKGGQLLATLMTGRDDITVTKVITQHELKNLLGRSVRLDIHALDHDKRDIDIEIQRAKKGATPKRIRHISAMMDANFLLKSEDPEDLPEQYIFFVTEHDVTGFHQLIAPVERRMGKNWNVPFRDGSHIAYLDASQADDSPLGKLMHDFLCSRAEDMYYPLLKGKVQYFKETDEGVTVMCDLMEEFLKEEHAAGFDRGKAEGKAEGIAAATMKFIRKQLKRKTPYQQIAEDTETPLDEVLRIAKELNMVY